MSQTLKRGGGSARKTVAAAGKARKLRRARAQTGSMLDRALALMPVSDSQLHRLFLSAILGGAAVLAWAVASLAGLPAMAAEQVAQVARQAGFTVRNVEVHGVRHLNELQVYERVLARPDQAMPEVDLAGLRSELMSLSWVKDARVARQLPDTLVIDIVERTPHAVLRDGAADSNGADGGHLVLIDDTGHALEPISAAKARGYLVLAGNGVGAQVAALGTLLDAAPALGPEVAQAQWVGNRRWNLTFRTGQLLALPEGPDEAASALMAFARLDGTNRLIGGKAMAFDMRAGDRIYIRVPNRIVADAQALADPHIASSDSAPPSPASGQIAGHAKDHP